MKRFLTIFLGLAGPLVADPQLVPQDQVAFTAGSSGTWNADWQGVEHRVYFMQWSLDMVTWNYCPFIHFGPGIQSRGVTSTSAKFFIRLVYYDDPNLETLEQAKNADYDQDGVSNLDEVTVLHTNPTRFATNGGTIGDGAQDWDGDGISNADEVALGLDPGVDNTGGTSGAALTQYSYDDTSRLIGITSAVSTKAYNLDEEGNIEGQ